MCGVKRLAWLVPWHREEIPNLNLMIHADFLWLILEQKKRAGVPPATSGLHICLLFYLCEVIKSWHFISVHSTVLWPLLIDCPPSSNTPSLRLSNQPFSQIPLWPLFHFSNILNPPFFPCFFSLFSSLQSSMSQSQSSQQPTSNALDFILPRLCGVTETPWIIWSLSWLVSRCFQARGAIFEPHSQADTHCFSRICQSREAAMLENMSRRNRSLLSLFLTSLALTLSVCAFCTSYWCEGTHKVVKPLCLSPVKLKNCGQNNSQPYTTGESRKQCQTLFQCDWTWRTGADVDVQASISR